MDNSSLSTSFNFNTQSGVLAVLAAVRQSALTPAQKNELRDLVFLYANGGGDVSVRLSLEQKLTAYKIQPVAGNAAPLENTTATAAVVLPFGSSRPAPVFTAPATSVRPTVVSVPSSVATKASVVSESVSIPPSVVPAPVTVAANPMAAPVVQTTVGTAQSLSTPVSDAQTNYLDRIREIKTAVNSKVGNPVNLVDIDNVVGREYMNALLDAMKRLSSGAGQVEPAMQRLELAFAAVETAIALHEQVSKDTVVPAAVENNLAPGIALKVEPSATASLTESVLSDVAKDIQPAVPTPAVPPVLEPSLVTKPAFAEVSLVREDDTRWDAQSIPAVPSAPTAPPNPVFTAPEPAVFAAPTVAPLSAEEAPRTPADLPDSAALSSNATDPLFSKEVDAGLEQLLSDWVLFKKSGLFGSGPRGREHPLFKKIAPLQIPLLLAGRFEGSTQEIKQSITDYMNGWRYEQGIIYEQGETFEHYLRRVIKQILDLQKKRRPS